MSNTVRRLGLVIGLLCLALTSLAQGSKLRYETELGQLTDLEGGYLLVPVELGSTGIAANNAQAAAQREDRRAFEQAFAQGFTLATVYFFNVVDTARLNQELLNLDVWDAAGNPPENWPPDVREVFVLEFKDKDAPVDPDVVITNSIVQRREARARMFSEKKQARRRKRAERLRKKMRHGAAIWDHPKLVRHVNRLRRLEEGPDTTAFQFTYSHFDPENTDASGWIIHRYTPQVVVKHADLRYDFDYHYFVKVHYQTTPEIRYPDAVAFLERKLRARLVELREKY